nr:movement protein [Sunn-hemp mottle virus]
MTANGRSLFTFDILKDVLKHAEDYTYVDILGVVLSGQWLLPKGTPGSAEIILLDSRLKGKASVLAVFNCRAASQEFQFLLSPGYSLTCVDALKKPFEISCNVVDLPVKDGFTPLSVEIACLVQFSNCVITRSLTRKLKENPATKTFSVEDIDELLGSMTSLRQIEGLRKKKNPEDLVQGHLSAEYDVKRAVKPRGPKGNLGQKRVVKSKEFGFGKNSNVSTFNGDTESVTDDGILESDS